MTSPSTTEDVALAQMDREANAFAMELLMPEEWLRADLAKLGGVDIEDEQRIGRLAKKYGVSSPVMILRIAQLANEATP